VTSDLHASRYWWRPGPGSVHKGYKKPFTRCQRLASLLDSSDARTRSAKSLVRYLLYFNDDVSLRYFCSFE
jgi:hypothetical protein